MMVWIYKCHTYDSYIIMFYYTSQWYAGKIIMLKTRSQENNYIFLSYFSEALMHVCKLILHKHRVGFYRSSTPSGLDM